MKNKEQVTRNKGQAARLRDLGVLMRTYEPQDREQVWALHQEGLRDTDALYPDADPRWDDDLRRIEEVYLTEGSHFWVAEAGDGLVGMTAVLHEDVETARLRRMRVTAGWRRRGLGQALLEVAEEFCRRHGYRRIVLDTTDRQQAARRLYERNGYVSTGERQLGEMQMVFYRKELA
jgi:GNAT superfamily N-acetyltransferase